MIYKNVSYNDKIFRDSEPILEKEIKYFAYFGKLYFFPKIHKILSNVPGRPVISKRVGLTSKIQGITWRKSKR